jgi:hypothetical protein
MGHGRHVTGSSYPTPAAPAPVADYNVATNPALNPDCSCNYFLAGTHGAKPYYRRADGAWFIWWYQLGYSYVITALLGVLGSGGWSQQNIVIPGNYAPYGTANGTATVSAGPH